jgi:SAM-dependent methyltransferase
LRICKPRDIASSAAKGCVLTPFHFVMTPPRHHMNRIIIAATRTSAIGCAEFRALLKKMPERDRVSVVTKIPFRDIVMRSVRELGAFAVSWGAPMWRYFFVQDGENPIDRLYGIETSARVSRYEIRTGSQIIDQENIGYGGMQPSILRKCLDILPIEQDSAFIDLGCGKGRALAVATEYPFSRIIGVEISPVVCAVAHANAKRIAAKFYDRVVPEIVEDDATRFSVPNCSTIVLFAYNPFKRPLVEKLLRHIDEVTAAHPRLKIFLIYYNPVHFDLMDSNPRLSRFFARKIELDEEERAAAPKGWIADSVVIYQLRRQDMSRPHPGADARIRVTLPDRGAEVS